MPGLAPIPLQIQEEEWKDAKVNLLRTLNYLIKDIYEHLGIILGVDDKVFQPESIELPSGTTMTEHNHTSSAQGGDHPWADFVAADVTYLQALVAAITVTNLVDKSAAEVIAASWQFPTVKLTDLTDGYLPYHVSDALGLANSPLYTDGTDVGLVGTIGALTGIFINLTDGFIPYHASDAAGLDDSPISTDGTNVEISGTLSPLEDMAYFFGGR